MSCQLPTHLALNLRPNPNSLGFFWPLLLLLIAGCNSANPFRTAQTSLDKASQVPEETITDSNSPANLSLSDSGSLPDYLQTATVPDSSAPDSSPAPSPNLLATTSTPAADAPGAVTPASSTSPAEPQSSPNGLTSAARRTFGSLLAPLAPGSRDHSGGIAAEIAAFKPFPFSFELPNVAGEMVNSKNFGGQLMLVDVWATWCGPCKTAIPELIEIQNEYQSMGVEIVGITCDSDDPQDAADVARKAFNIGKQLQVNYPLLVDNGTTIPQIPGFRGYPTMLFLTPDGQVRYMVTGVQSREKLAAMIQAVLQM